ncbi:MAG: hypothetical protein SP1CHLAM54_14720 [Chlamydiia bacterium]|nr:hypothetical protein [Chlamydiia bacterium]MCH9616362.1 hypothetical protein [Chlamydiia bacterium]MCH9629652.1 hypothetical protein [Chlamydiia bacterium]
MKALDAQDAYLFRALERARNRAKELVPDDGTLDESVKFLTRFSAPVGCALAEKYIKQSIGVPDYVTVTTVHVRRAVLSALFVPLRQNVGSCFATAPAILVQSMQQKRMLDDLFQLIYRGLISRVIDGKDFKAPISQSSGLGSLKKRVKGTYVESLGLLPSVQHANRYLTVEEWIRETLFRKYGLEEKDLDYLVKSSPFAPDPKKEVQEFLREEGEIRDEYKALTDHALLKAWEYTIASFADYKVEFFRWNLYASMGFDHNEEGGIGQLIYDHLDMMLKKTNAEFDAKKDEVEMAYNRMKATQAQLARASSYEDSRRLKAQYQMEAVHYDGLRDMLEDQANLSEKYAHFFKFLMESYAEELSKHFQEVFDPEMVDEIPDLYDDAPAGFRLLYKHGRADPGLWEIIRNKNDFARSLVNFFQMTEYSITEKCEWKKGKSEIEEVTTMVMRHVETETFLQSASDRISKKQQKKRNPWSYASGGTMHSLVKCYFGTPNEIREEKRWVDSPVDLLTFLVDTMKGAPGFTTNRFLESQDGGLLMHSPTHAFILKPGLPSFREGWVDSGFTYTWVRDRVIEPAQIFYGKISLTPSDQKDLIRFTGINVSPSNQSLTVPEFRELLCKKSRPDTVDTFLRSAFPLIPRASLKGYSLPTCDVVPYKMYRDLTNETEIRAPRGIAFADTNWAFFYFSFIVNPGTLELELWRSDQEGFEGIPMVSWEHLINGTSKQEWGVFTDPRQYGM